MNNAKTYLAQFGNPESRVRALNEIPLGQPLLVEILLEALEDPYARVRFSAGQRLSELDEEDRIRIHFRDELSLEGKQAAMLSFCKSELEKESQNLVFEHAISPQNPGIRYHALLALHEFAKEDVVKAATKSVFDNGDEDALIVASQWAAIYKWKSFIPAIVAEFSASKGNEFRFQLAVALSKLVNDKNDLSEEITELLIKSSLDDKVSMTACQAIARLQLRDAIKTLKRVPKKIFMHELNKVEAAATRAALGEKEGLALLEKFVLDKREHVSAYACECTGRYRLPLKDALLRASKKKDDRAASALKALEQIEAN